MFHTIYIRSKCSTTNVGEFCSHSMKNVLKLKPKLYQLSIYLAAKCAFCTQYIPKFAANKSFVSNSIEKIPRVTVTRLGKKPAKT